MFASLKRAETQRLLRACSLTIDALQGAPVPPRASVRCAVRALRGGGPCPLAFRTVPHDAQGHQGDQGGQEEQRGDDDHRLLVLPNNCGGQSSGVRRGDTARNGPDALPGFDLSFARILEPRERAV